MPSAPVTFTATGQLVPTTTPADVLALVVTDTSGSANRVRLFAGSSASGPMLGAVDLAANASATLTLAHPLRAPAGVYASCTGAVAATAWLA